MTAWLIVLGTLGQLAQQTVPQADGARTATSRQPERSLARSSWPRKIAANRRGDAWRYLTYQGRWWYWSASERWSYFDGTRWIPLDSLNRPMRERGDWAARERQPSALSGPRNLRFRFGDLPSPRSRAGSFETGDTASIADRNFAGTFLGADSLRSLLSAPTESRMTATNPYGPDSAYGAYGSTNPLRGGMHTGAGGNYGYGLGAQRPAFPSGRASAPLFNQPR